MKETSRYPTRRCQEVIEYDDGSRKRICYSNNCPHYYQDEAGQLRTIDLGLREKQNGKVGKHHVRDRHVVSVGHRDNGDHSKVLAFRPDVNQALGTEQLEFSLDAIKFDGASQATDLSRNDKVDDLTTKLGSVIVRSTRQRTRQLILVDRPITSFQIRYTLHVKGLTIEERYGEFWFFGEADGEFRFRIRKPCLCGEDFQPLDIKGELVEHNLVANHDGTFTYTKTSTAALGKADLPAVYYIDADTYYSSTADGHVNYEGLLSWDTLHDAGTGDEAVDDSTSSGYSFQAAFWAPDDGRIRRVFFYFDTASTLNPSVVDLKIYGHSKNEADVSAQQGTQADTLTTADYDAFAGSEYGYNDSWSTIGYNTISFNSTGVNEINTSGVTKICCRERSHDYLDSQPDDAYRSGLYFADETGTDKDPYLEITEGAATCDPWYYYAQEQAAAL